MRLKRLVIPIASIATPLAILATWYLSSPSKVTLTPTKPEQGVGEGDEVQVLEPSIVFGRVDIKPLYRYLRLGGDGGAYIDSGVISELLKQVVRGVRVKGGRLSFKYKIIGNMVHLSVR